MVKRGLVVAIAATLASAGVWGAEELPQTPASQVAQPLLAATAQSPATKAESSPAAEVAATLTITTGGGNKINDRWIEMFRKTRWRLNYRDAPAIEMAANQALAADGYDVEARLSRQGWHVETIMLGDPEKYVPPGDGNEESKANLEKGGRFIVGLLASVLSGGRIDGGNIADSPTINSGHTKYITKDMVSGIPPGAKKILLTRIINPVYRAQQEILTVAYTDVSDDELRRINAVPMLEMIGMKPNGDKNDEK
jgi:pyruvate/2-oxoglutarate dehydrogenase complex dihydrolipoamide acyltransferase (E2) component